MSFVKMSFLLASPITPQDFAVKFISGGVIGMCKSQLLPQFCYSFIFSLNFSIFPLIFARATVVLGSLPRSMKLKQAHLWIDVETFRDIDRNRTDVLPRLCILRRPHVYAYVYSSVRKVLSQRANFRTIWYRCKYEYAQKTWPWNTNNNNSAS